MNGADGFKRNISRKTHYLILDEVYKQFQFGKQHYLEMYLRYMILLRNADKVGSKTLMF